MPEYGFEGTNRIDDRDVDPSELWKELGVVQSKVDDLTRECGIHVGVMTHEGAQKILDATHAESRLSPEERDRQSSRRIAEIVAYHRMLAGEENPEFEAAYGEPFNLEAFQARYRLNRNDPDGGPGWA